MYTQSPQSRVAALTLVWLAARRVWSLNCGPAQCYRNSRTGYEVSERIHGTTDNKLAHETRTRTTQWTTNSDVAGVRDR